MLWTACMLIFGLVLIVPPLWLLALHDARKRQREEAEQNARELTRYRIPEDELLNARWRL